MTKTLMVRLLCWRSSDFVRLLSLVFTFFNAFEDCKARLFGIRNGQGLRRVKGRPDLANGLLTGGTLSQRRSGKRSNQSKLSPAYLALPVADFVFVNRHITPSRPTLEQSNIARQ